MLSFALHNNRRNYEPRGGGPGGQLRGLWPSAEARVASLRHAVTTLLAQSLSPEDRRSPTILTLLSGIFTRQLWDIVQRYSDPDILNGYIVKYGKSSASTAIAAMAAGDLPEDLQHAPEPVADAAGAASSKSVNDPAVAEAPRAEPMAPAPLDHSELSEGCGKSLFQNPSSATEQDKAFSSLSRRTPGVSASVTSAFEDLELPHEPHFFATETDDSREKDDASKDASIRGNTRRSGAIRDALTAPLSAAAMPADWHSAKSAAASPEANASSTESVTVPRLDEPLIDLSDTSAPAEPWRADGVTADADPTAEMVADDSNPWDSTMPSNIPKGVKEPPLPPSLRKSRADAAPAYEVRHPPLPRRVQDVLSWHDGDLLDAFETYLNQQDSSSPSEGATLLQLHANLEVLVSTVEHDTTTPALFTSDVHSVLRTAEASLPDDERCAAVRRAMGEVMMTSHASPALLQPLQRAILARLQQLYESFVQARTAKAAPAPSAVPTATAPREKASSASYGQLDYVARHIPQSTSGPPYAGDISVVDVSPNADSARPVDVRTLQVLVTMENTLDGGGGYALLRSWSQFEALHADLERMYAQRPTDSGFVPPPKLPSLRGKHSGTACALIRTYLMELLAPTSEGLAWCATTQAVQRFLDKTRYGEDEARRSNVLMTSLGGMSRTLASGVAGTAGIARKGINQFAPAPGRAGRTMFGGSERRSAELQRGEQRASVDGSAPSDTRPPGLPPRHPPLAVPAPAACMSSDKPLSGNSSYAPETGDAAGNVVKAPAVAESRCAVREKKLAANAQGDVPRATDPTTGPMQGSASGKGSADTPAAKGSLASGSGAVAAPTSKASGDSGDAAAAAAAAAISPHDINALLSALFSVTREALNLQGTWTLRGGLLRVLEQYLRTTYSTSAANTLAYFASMLSLESQVSWLELLRTSLWPNDEWSTEAAPTRSEAEKRATAEEARLIVESYAPPQASYALGIGGKQACIDALRTVHAVVTDPVVALDLHLALLLRTLELATGTAGLRSGDRAK